ncbi:MAG: hypothetical protein C6H99_00260 [Epsilonproteobacteria bacterium]|nr:hypothetical protein [Campylobacterota bacterium]NPA64764.1 trimeric intracellular cation channel family protein [Campylobacterota bacterium]
MSILEIADIVGIVAFALSGYWVAARERLDLLGGFISSFLTALGGGVMRDVIVSRPPYAFVDWLPATIVTGVVFIAFFLKLQRFFDYEKRRIFIVSDSIGLVAFSISGALVGIEAGFGFWGVALLALVTAVGGGVLRDILLNRVPLILSSDFYGSVAIVAGGVIYGLERLELLGSISLTLLFLALLFLRIVAYRFGWRLPKIL